MTEPPAEGRPGVVVVSYNTRRFDLIRNPENRYHGPG